MKKRTWEKPRLIVLFRGRQEENVLNGCKTTGAVNKPAGNDCISGGLSCMSPVSS